MPPRFYKVGGCVRDALLGRSVNDNDWVVVGGKPEEMLADGFRQVGRDFPVFLHPETKEEYALARTERKTGTGHTEFAFDTRAEISLEDDLHRRDLTVNAMAMTDQGDVIDPYGGRDDLQRELLRHVSPAFVEDPLRVLRVARFASQLGFAVAPETITLMQRMAESGELSSLTAERVWQEWRKALAGVSPVAFFRVLSSCRALPILFPSHLVDDDALRVLEKAAGDHVSALTRFAAHMAAVVQPQWQADLAALCRRYRIPNACRDLALLAVASHSDMPASGWRADALLVWLDRADAFRRPDRFVDLLDVLTARSVTMDNADTYRQHLATAERARAAIATVEKNGPRALLPPELTGAAIGKAIKAHRLDVIAADLSE